MSNFEPVKLDKYEYGDIRFLNIRDYDGSDTYDNRLTVDVCTGDHGVFIISEWANIKDEDPLRSIIVWPQDIPAIIKALTAGYNHISDIPYDSEKVTA